MDVVSALARQVRAGDVAVFLGAGDIREQGERFVDFLKAGEGRR